MSNREAEKGTEERDTRRFWLLTVATVLGIIAILQVIVRYCFDDWESRGQFGDTFGAVNALFSGLAFAGLIYTIRLQSIELALQRDELKQSSAAQRASADALHRQAKLQAYTTLLAALREKSSMYRPYAIERRDWDEQRDKYEREISKMLDAMAEDDIETVVQRQ